VREREREKVIEGESEKDRKREREREEVGEVVVATLDDLALEELVLWEHRPVRECVFVCVSV